MAIVSTFIRCSTLVVSALLLSMVNRAVAGVNSSSIRTENILIQKPALTISIIGEALTGWISTSEQKVGFAGAWGAFGATITAPVAGIRYSEGGAHFTVYDILGPSGTSSGIGFVLKTESRDCLIGNICVRSGPYAQSQDNNYQQFRDVVLANEIFYTYSIRLIATSQNIASGSLVINTGQIGVATLRGIMTDEPSILLNGLSMTYEQRGCIASVSPPVIYMGVVSPLQFSGVNSTVKALLPATVTLQCDSGLGVYATMTDQNDIGNSSDTLVLTPGSGNIATGVGVRFLKESNQAVVYGPSTSAVEPASPAPGQWEVKQKNNSNNIFSFILTPEYIQTADPITPGDANAVASITFAYY